MYQHLCTRPDTKSNTSLSKYRSSKLEIMRRLPLNRELIKSGVGEGGVSWPISLPPIVQLVSRPNCHPSVLYENTVGMPEE